MNINSQRFLSLLFFFPYQMSRLTRVKFPIGFGTQISEEMHLGFCELSKVGDWKTYGSQIGGHANPSQANQWLQICFSSALPTFGEKDLAALSSRNKLWKLTGSWRKTKPMCITGERWTIMEPRISRLDLPASPRSSNLKKKNHLKMLFAKQFSSQYSYLSSLQ